MGKEGRRKIALFLRPRAHDDIIDDDVIMRSSKAE